MIKLIVQYYRATISSISCLRIFCVNYGSHQYQSKLKDQLIKTLSDKILFLITENIDQVILQRNSLIAQKDNLLDRSFWKKLKQLKQNLLKIFNRIKQFAIRSNSDNILTHYASAGFKVISSKNSRLLSRGWLSSFFGKRQWL